MYCVQVTQSDLLAVPEGPRTEATLRTNCTVGVQYLEAWLGGMGCVPIDNLMEDAATAEICRTQVCSLDCSLKIEPPVDQNDEAAGRCIRTCDQAWLDLPHAGACAVAMIWVHAAQLLLQRRNQEWCMKHPAASGGGARAVCDNMLQDATRRSARLLSACAVTAHHLPPSALGFLTV